MATKKRMSPLSVASIFVSFAVVAWIIVAAMHAIVGQKTAATPLSLDQKTADSRLAASLYSRTLQGEKLASFVITHSSNAQLKTIAQRWNSTLPAEASELEAWLKTNDRTLILGFTGTGFFSIPTPEMIGATRLGAGSDLRSIQAMSHLAELMSTVGSSASFNDETLQPLLLKIKKEAISDVLDLQKVLRK